MEAAEDGARKRSLVVTRKKSLTVAKAAMISSAMLSQRGAPSGGATRESLVALSDLLQSHRTKPPPRTGIIYAPRIADVLEQGWALRLLQTACFFSLVTVCLHTPHTFALFPPLAFIVLVVDALCTLLFSIEAGIRILNEGLFEYKTSYLRTRWSQFDFFLLLNQWLSLLLHVYQLVGERFPHLGFPYSQWFGAVRALRPFIVVRLIRLAVKFKLPKHRIEQLLKRSSQQVQNVTVFFVFFMALYAIVGIQLFGRMDYHCVQPNTDPNNVTIADLAIPDTMCSPKGEGGYECPDNLVCMRLNMNAKAEGFYGMFNDFGASVFTVYLAASEEGWVYVLYDCMDSLPSHFAFIYFLTLIFFLAWLVKNVFIAVITETFAEIRVQFSEMWQKKEVTLDEEFREKLEKGDEGAWRLVRLDAEKLVEGRKMKLQQASPS